MRILVPHKCEWLFSTVWNYYEVNLSSSYFFKELASDKKFQTIEMIFWTLGPKFFVSFFLFQDMELDVKEIRN